MPPPSPSLRSLRLHDLRCWGFIIWAGWGERVLVDLPDDPHFKHDYVLLLPGGLGGGQWVRRDSARDVLALDEARRWGEDVWNRVILPRGAAVPTRWWCGEILRPSLFRDGAPAPSPLTQEP